MAPPRPLPNRVLLETLPSTSPNASSPFPKPRVRRSYGPDSEPLRTGRSALEPAPLVAESGVAGVIPNTEPIVFQDGFGAFDTNITDVDAEVDRRAAVLAAGQVTQAANTNPGTPDVKEKTPSTYSFLNNSNYSRKYTLELYENDATDPIASIELPYVNSLSMDQPLSVVRTWTLAGTPYEEHSGFVQRTFRIAGRSGYSPMALTRFAKFRNFLETYAKLSRENMTPFTRAKDIKIVLNFLWEGESWWATVVGFRYQREVASTRVSYAYELTLVTNGVAASRWNPENGINFITCSEQEDGCHISPLHYCHAKFEEVFLTIPAAAAPAISTPSTLKVKELTKTDPQNVPITYNSLSNATIKARSVAGYDVPSVVLTDWSYWYRLATLCGLSQKELLYALQALPEPARTLARRWTVTVMRYIVDLRLQCLLQLGIRFIRHNDRIDAPNTGVPHRPRPLPNKGLPVITIQVTQGQSSAMDIAASHLGNRNLWTQVTLLNGMIDARTKNDGSPLIAGDILLIPSTSGLSNIDPDTFYGTNLLFRGGDLVSVGDRDIGTISGISNFYQNFRHRMLTTRGHNRTYPDFGLPKLVGSDDMSDVPGQVLSNVRRQTLSDHRVSEINEMTLNEQGGSLDVSLTIVTALREKASAGFSYPT